MRVVLLAIVALSFLHDVAASQTNAPSPPVQVEAWPLDKIATLGRAIHTQDVASARATDALLARFNGKPPEGLLGWIVVEEGPAQRVRFLIGSDDSVRAGYDIVVTNGQASEVGDVADGTLSDSEQARFKARQTAATNIGALRCAARYNAVVLDDPDSDGWLVWLLASTTDANAVPIGGHYRFRISADGETMLQRDQLSNSCLTLDRRQAVQNGQVVGLVTSSIVSPQPVETHVFLSLLYGTRIYVSAGDDLFAVQGDRIRKVDVNR